MRHPVLWRDGCSGHCSLDTGLWTVADNSQYSDNLDLLAAVQFYTVYTLQTGHWEGGGKWQGGDSLIWINLALCLLYGREWEWYSGFIIGQWINQIDISFRILDIRYLYQHILCMTWGRSQTFRWINYVSLLSGVMPLLPRSNNLEIFAETETSCVTDENKNIISPCGINV